MNLNDLIFFFLVLSLCLSVMALSLALILKIWSYELKGHKASIQPVSYIKTNCAMLMCQFFFFGNVY